MVKKTTEKKSKSSVVEKTPSTYLQTKKITHLFFQEKFLRHIPQISQLQHLHTLYLYNNDISKIEKLDEAVNLQRLYLQHNKISKIENLDKLVNLRNLYLGHNSISVVEGMEYLLHLEELHIEKQNTPHGSTLCFDPRTIVHLARSLQILNISHNGISSVMFLTPLRFLRCLNAAHNKIEDIGDVCETVEHLLYLSDATFTGNPISKKHRYREDIITSAACLKSLDNKDISNETRAFLKQFERQKLLRGNRLPINLADNNPNLPRNYPPSIQKAVSASIIKDAQNNLLQEDSDTFDERNAKYITWKSLPRKSILKNPKKLNENKIIHNPLSFTFL